MSGAGRVLPFSIGSTIAARADPKSVLSLFFP